MSTKRGVAAIVLTGALAASTRGLAETPRGAEALQQPAQTGLPLASLGTHAVNGVVAFVDTSTLVIVRSGKHPTEMTFVLRPATRREGPLKTGSAVSVRYRTEEGMLVATGIFAREHREAR